MKKVIGQLHLWLGLASGLIVFIVSITGCIYVFEQELKDLFYNDRKVVDIPDHGIRKPLSRLLLVAQQEAGVEHPIQNIEVPKEEGRTYVFSPAQIRNNNASTHFGEIVYQHKIYINPYTAEVIKNENTKYEFFTLVLRLHRNLLLNREVGKTIIGSSVIIFVVLIITGIVLWWPKNMAAIRQRISLRWKKTTKWKRKNYDIHNVFGFYSSFFILIIALTGITWSFDWFDHSVQWLANGGEKTKKIKPLKSDTTHVAAIFPIDKILTNVKNQNKEAHTFNIGLPEKSSGVVNITARVGAHVRYSSIRYQFDQYSAAHLKTSTFDEKNAGEKLKAMNYDIHTGAIMNLPGQILAFIVSLISASLPITGLFIWIGRTKKAREQLKMESLKQKAENPRYLQQV